MSQATDRAFISKSRYLSGLQCSRLLWHLFNRPDLVPKPTPAQQGLFDEGHKVGRLAQDLFPGGVMLRQDGMRTADVLAATAVALPRRVPLYEAAFRHQDAYFQADILVPAGEDGWDCYEVKGSTGVKDYHLEDLAFQRWVAEGSGLKVRSWNLVTLNNAYVRNGPLDTRELFAIHDLVSETAVRVPLVEGRLESMRLAIAQADSPNVPIGPRCSDPYECPMKPLCWGFLPGENVTQLRRGRELGFRLLAGGVTALADVPDGAGLNPAQSIQVAAARTRQPHVEKEGLQAFLESLRYPLCFLDFETMSLPIPPFDRCRPYQQIPFQFSLHVQETPEDAPSHHSFLAEGVQDPRPAFLSELKSVLGERGSIVVYNASFEKTRLSEAARDFPEHADWIEAALERVVDLMQPFANYHMYDPRQLGSASIKAVLPAWTGTGYEVLQGPGGGIADGGTASSEYVRVTFNPVEEEDRKRVRAALEAYCRLDTEAMVRLLEVLQGLA